MILQKRATEAIELGLSISSPGYNIYVAGVQGTGKATVIKEFLSRWAKNSKPPHDWVYVNNFSEPENPRVVRLENGQGITFKKRITQLIKHLKEEITFTLHSEDYENVVNAHLSSANERKTAMYTELEKHAKGMDFAIKSSQLGIETVPVIDGEAIDDADYFTLSSEAKEQIEKKRALLEPEVLDFARKVRSIELESKSYIENLRTSLGEKIVTGLMEELFHIYQDNDTLLAYLNEFKEDVVENMLDFVELEDEEEEHGQDSRKNELTKYKVNLFVDNSGLSGAPIIMENHPTYYNVFGKVEKHIEHGVYQTDFHSVKPGAIHKANGGYLVINAIDIFKTTNIWDTLKKILRNRLSFIEDYGEHLSLLPTSGLRPESIPLDVKVILIGNDEIYRILFHQDEEFVKIFKIKAEFDDRMPRSSKNIRHLCSFIASRVEREGLLHLGQSALAALVEFSSRVVEDTDFMTTQFSLVKDLIVEADYFAKSRNAKLIDRKDIEKALDHKYFRLCLREESTLDLYKAEDILVSLKGSKVGQVNGLAVYDFGDFSFGKVGRITCTTAMTEGGVVNIERASRLSGRIHDKGMYILSAFMHTILAKEGKLGITANVCFEQSYGMIDGDSASAAELVAIFSALAQIPIMQNFAITGSINQMGEIQAVGGVNEKIEGFYKLMKMRSTAKQSHGIIIPKTNQRSLMLHHDVREAIDKGQLAIYPVSYFWEVFELCTGVAFGVADIHHKKAPAPESAVGQILTWLKERRAGATAKARKPATPRKKTTRSRVAVAAAKPSRPKGAAKPS